MSISTMYLASGSTPENDTRMVGNILLRQGDKEHRQERTRPEEPTYDQAGRAPGPPSVAGTKLSPATESESARRSRVGDAESWELERPGASGHRPREPLPRAGERPRPWLPAGPEPAQLRSVLPRVGSFRISFFRQVLLLVLMRASKLRRIKRSYLPLSSPSRMPCILDSSSPTFQMLTLYPQALSRTAAGRAPWFLSPSHPGRGGASHGQSLRKQTPGCLSEQLEQLVPKASGGKMPSPDEASSLRSGPADSWKPRAPCPSPHASSEPHATCQTW